MSRTLKYAGIVLVGVVVSIGAAAGWIWLDFNRWLNSPIDASSNQTVNFVIPRGAGLDTLWNLLSNQGLISNRRYYRLYAKLYGLGGKIKSGEYEVKRSITPKRLFEKIARGEVATATVTIPEGLTVREIAQKLVEANVLYPDEAKKFVRYCLSKQAAKDYGFDAPSLEGYLFPDTYKFARHIPFKKVVDAMVARFKSIWTPQFAKRAKELGFTQNQIVTLASIIEKETGAPEERPIISSVYHNRLRIGMKLQADPTVIYGIPNFDGNLTRKHLETDHPYNTYTRKGLPPGPIASPGYESIRAALYPAKTDYLYFVSMNNGRHKFSKTYAEHKKAVEKYQIRGKKGKK